MQHCSRDMAGAMPQCPEGAEAARQRRPGAHTAELHRGVWSQVLHTNGFAESLCGPLQRQTPACTKLVLTPYPCHRMGCSNTYSLHTRRSSCHHSSRSGTRQAQTRNASVFPILDSRSLLPSTSSSRLSACRWVAVVQTDAHELLLLSKVCLGSPWFIASLEPGFWQRHARGGSDILSRLRCLKPRDTRLDSKAHPNHHDLAPGYDYPAPASVT